MYIRDYLLQINSSLTGSEYHMDMPPEEPPPLDIPPPPEAIRLTELKERREVLEKKLADEKAKLKRMQADRRALLRKQIKHARSRLSSAERKRRTQRLIVLGSYLEHQTEGNPAAQARLRKDLDAFVTRNDHRELFGLPPLDKPTIGTPAAAPPSAPTGSRDDPIPGWHPFKLSDGWRARFDGDTSKLPDDLVGSPIAATTTGKSWSATVLEVKERSVRHVLVRLTDPPTS